MQIIDDGDPAFTSTGFATVPGQGFNNDVQFAAAGNGSAIARWSFDNLKAGQYRVSATWSAHPNRATNAPFVIRDGAGNQLGIVSVNQELSPGDFFDANVGWEDLGAPINFSGGSLIVELSNAANEFVIADAIRIERTGDFQPSVANAPDSSSNSGGLKFAASSNAEPDPPVIDPQTLGQFSLAAFSSSAAVGQSKLPQTSGALSSRSSSLLTTAEGASLLQSVDDDDVISLDAEDDPASKDDSIDDSSTRLIDNAFAELASEDIVDSQLVSGLYFR